MITAAVLVVGGGCGGGGGDDAQTTTTVVVPAPTTTSVPDEEQTTTTEPPAGEPDGPAETATEDPRVNARERAAANTVRAYVAALDARDGEAVCALLAPGSLAAVELPERRASCGASVAASIGYRDPRGLPVWEGADVARARVIDLARSGDEATVIATVVTRFSDRPEASIEDDVIYLVRAGGRWLVAKPSSTLYRAVGIADVPPSVLSPPN